MAAHIDRQSLVYGWDLSVTVCVVCMCTEVYAYCCYCSPVGVTAFPFVPIIVVC